MERITDLPAGFAIPAVVGRVRAPLLVLGAGRDLIVPPAEAIRLAAAEGDNATLVWYAAGSHALFNLIPLWTGDAASWLADLFGPPSTRVDDPLVSTWRGEPSGLRTPPRASLDPARTPHLHSAPLPSSPGACPRP